MSFISYAQNLEDVMLWRALKGVTQGFYIDVGANDPTIDSVTKAFYERGWYGINIEPLTSHWTDLARERTRDTNLRCAAGDSPGELELWEADVRGWATSSPEVVKKHQEEGHHGVWHKVPVRTLSEICEAHAPADIHLLKIDVEGFEQSVIEGMDFDRFRPWVVVVEATLPNSTVENHQSWESMVLRHGYNFVYADGLNRYYLAQERIELSGAFKYPPNVFDGFKLASLENAEAHASRAEARAAEAEARAAEAEARAAEAEARAAEAEARAAEAEARAAEAQAQIRSILCSTSWRITTPLRILSRWIRAIWDRDRREH